MHCACFACSAGSRGRFVCVTHTTPHSATPAHPRPPVPVVPDELGIDVNRCHIVHNAANLGGAVLEHVAQQAGLACGRAAAGTAGAGLQRLGGGLHQRPTGRSPCRRRKGPAHKCLAPPAAIGGACIGHPWVAGPCLLPKVAQLAMYPLRRNRAPRLAAVQFAASGWPWWPCGLALAAGCSHCRATLADSRLGSAQAGDTSGPQPMRAMHPARGRRSSHPLLRTPTASAASGQQAISGRPQRHCHCHASEAACATPPRCAAQTSSNAVSHWGPLTVTGTGDMLSALIMPKRTSTPPPASTQPRITAMRERKRGGRGSLVKRPANAAPRSRGLS